MSDANAEEAAILAYEEGDEEDYGFEEAGSEDYTPMGSSDDVERERKYKEYKLLVKNIKYQNEIIDQMKKQIQELNCKPCLQPDEVQDLNATQCCLQQEQEKMKCLINKAMHLQNFGSHRHYREIPLITTFDEDLMSPIPMTCATMQVQSNKKSAGRHEPGTCMGASGAGSGAGAGDYNINDMGGQSCQDNGNFDSEDEKLIDDILDAFEKCQAKMPKARKMEDCSSKTKKKAKVCFEDEEGEDASVGKLFKKMQNMQNEIATLRKKLCQRDTEGDSAMSGPGQEMPKPCLLTNSSFSQEDSANLSSICKKGKTLQTDEFDKLKSNYLYLLTEFQKKDGELKDLKQKAKGICGALDKGKSKPDECDPKALRDRINEMKEQQDHFKCLMKERALQIEDYNNRYLEIQQKNKKQALIIKSLNATNKRVEKQINLEIKGIRAKFEEKCAELLQYPRLLKNEQAKVAEACKERSDLENKLIIVCKELQNKKPEEKAQLPDESCRPQLEQCQKELSAAQKAVGEMQKERDTYCDELKQAQEDLEILRSESANIIRRTSEKTQMIKEQFQEQVKQLEKELAQSRASSCFCIENRESLINDMQAKLNALSFSFDSAQDQIRILRNHIAYMSNERCYPTKC